MAIVSSYSTRRTLAVGSSCLISVYNEWPKNKQSTDNEHTLKSKINKTNNIITTASFNRIQNDSSFSNKVFSDDEPNPN